ncbi:MAG: YgiQ family radical SAM protein [Oscillospiraceae bacterium]|nr:YgiQ family radical SAM protein [Oscillospiraceae bacterium]
MFLPVTKDDMLARGWDEVDFVYVCGDAYVDHPSFGAAIITRVLENNGFTVAFLAQPDWHLIDDFTRFGRPRLGFLVSSGNIDSMVAHYTVAKRRRRDDAYSPGGISGKRPDRAVDVYCRCIREAYGDIPIVIGGLEASLRRFAHYDYWSDSVHPSILISSDADLLIFGMGERQITEIAERLRNGEKTDEMRDIRGVCYACDVKETPFTGVECPSFANVSENKREYAVAARIQQDEQDFFRGRVIKQRHGKRMVVQNIPAEPLTSKELDGVYELPYMRTYHPMYEKDGGVPAIKEVEFSVTHNRGCFGGCNFCSIAFHQGRYVVARSKESIIKEAKLLTTLPNFKGYIHDVGGPTANFRRPSCNSQEVHGLCKGKKCLAPTPCKNLVADHTEYIDILRSLRELKGVKKVFIRSGIRYDYLLADESDEFIRELVKYHVSGQLKVAPEHCSAAVLDKMGKPHIEAYLKFSKKYFDLSAKAGKEQYLVPYLMSSHPGSDLNSAVELALFIKKQKLHPEQVQDFYPTPGTISTAMFYTELDPYTTESVYVAKNPEDKAMQRALMQYFDPKNRALVIKALKKAGRYELIGTGANCLVPPDASSRREAQRGNARHNKNTAAKGKMYEKNKRTKKKN